MSTIESYDKTYDTIYNFLQNSISNKKFNPENLAIAQFESEELKKMSLHKKFLDVKKKFSSNVKGISTEQNFLNKLLNFENPNSVAKMMNRKLNKMNKTLRFNETSSILDKNKSV